MGHGEEAVANRPLVGYVAAMKRILKWLAVGVGAIVLLVVALAGGVWFYAFSGNSPIPDGFEVSPAARLVKDGFVDLTVIDLGNGAVALIDAGNDPKAGAILKELDRRQLVPESVAAIFLTHGHGDHIAGCRAFPRATVYALAEEAPLVEGHAKGRGLLTRMAPPNQKGIHVGGILHDGEVVTLGSRHFQVFATPGHTGGSAVYFVDGALYFGDSAGADKHGHMMPAVSLFSDDAAANLASLKSLEKRLEPQAGEIHRLVFAHTGPLDSFEPLREFAATH